MNINISQKPPYTPITQKPYCCVPACICMILDRRSIAHGTQAEIGYDLGLTIPEDLTHLFPKIKLTSKPSAGWGTRVQEEQYSINNYFIKNNIQLHETYFWIENISDVRDFIVQNIKDGNDIITCFNYDKLYAQGGDYGHVSLIQEIENNNVLLVDTERNVPKLRKVKLDNLIEAIRHHGESNRGGFWIIGKK